MGTFACVSCWENSSLLEKHFLHAQKGDSRRTSQEIPDGQKEACFCVPYSRHGKRVFAVVECHSGHFIGPFSLVNGRGGRGGSFLKFNQVLVPAHKVACATPICIDIYFNPSIPVAAVLPGQAFLQAFCRHSADDDGYKLCVLLPFC